MGLRLPAGLSAQCRCGHRHAAHLHYRSGTDCALCPCPRFRLRISWKGARDDSDRA